VLAAKGKGDAATFDVRTEATDMRQSFLATRWLYYWSIAAPLVFGPVLGYLFLTPYNGPGWGTVGGLLIGLPFTAIFSVLAVRIERRFPERVVIGGGRLSFQFPNGKLVDLDLNKLRSRVVIHTHRDDFSGCPKMSGRPIVPWAEGGVGRLLPLSHAASEALGAELDRIGWRREEKERPWGSFRFVTWTFRNPHA